MKRFLMVIFALGQILTPSIETNAKDNTTDTIISNRDCTEIVPNGTYADSVDQLSFPAGSVVCAEDDGQVVYTGEFNPNGYDMRGFVVASNQTKRLSNGVFERMSFVGGPECGNFTNSAMGDNTVILSSAFYGLGGRYLLSAYRKTNIEIRNVILRVDGGWGEGPGPGCSGYEPNAALIIYDTNKALCEGCINIDQNPTADSTSETLGGIGVNAHTPDLCHSVEIRNSLVFNGERFYLDGHGKCDVVFDNLKGRVGQNLGGTLKVNASTGDRCYSFKGSIELNNSNFESGNCADNTGKGVTLKLDTEFLDDPRWRNEMCGGFSSRSDGWCASRMSLSDYLIQ